jgi:hypothetical protein
MALPASTAPAAAADDAALRHSVQCFIATSTLLLSEDPKNKTVSLLASNFFAGQIFGAAPDIDLSAALRREAPLLDEAATSALLVQCGREMVERGKQISAAGRALDAAARPAPTD